MHVFRLLFFTAVLVVLSGCVSKPVESELQAPRLGIAQNGDGEVTIEWESERGRVYTVYYQSKPGADWKVLRNANRVPGTGGTLTAYDVVNPRAPIRRYRLLPEDQ